MTAKWREELGSDMRDMLAAMTEFQKKLAARPEDDWRASLAWEAVKEASNQLSQKLWDADTEPRKPDGFKHWREKYSYSNTL